MAISPSTDLYLLKLPIELNDENQLTFANATAQATYFLSLDKIGETDFTYQRRENAIRYPAHIDSIIQYNYVMYKNENYTNKWFYARIMNMEYINDGMTLISIEEDAFQTWQFDLNYSQCFVEREHVNDDTEGLHTVPEGLELGDYEIVDLRDSPLYAEYGDSRDWLPCFCVTKLPSATTNLQSNGRIANDVGYIGGVFSSLHFFAANTMAAAHEIIRIYENDENLTSDAIVNIFMIPSCCAYPVAAGDSSINSYTLRAIYNFVNITDYEDSTPVPFKLQQPDVLAENYRPVNKKLLTWPYSYFYVTNKSGQTIEYRYEDFPFETIGGYTRRTMSYEKTIIPCASLSAKLYFTNYKSYSESTGYGTKMYTYGIDYPKVPVCAWTTDYYTNWLTQNGVNVGTNLAMGIASAGLGMATGGLGLVAGGLSLARSIAGTIGQVHQAKTTPPQAHGDVNTGDFQYAMQRSSISFYEMSIRPEYAKIIDDYFSAYGYKVNVVKTPNVTGRLNWNFVKTIGSAIHADIPQGSCDRINSMFDNGLTLWHNPTTFRDYTQSNTIVTP
jgi:hypothetical protein